MVKKQSKICKRGVKGHEIEGNIYSYLMIPGMKKY